MGSTDIMVNNHLGCLSKITTSKCLNMLGYLWYKLEFPQGSQTGKIFPKSAHIKCTRYIHTVVSVASTGVTGMCCGIGFSWVPITEPLAPIVITTLPAPRSSNMTTAFSASSMDFTGIPVRSSACQVKQSILM